MIEFDNRQEKMDFNDNLKSTINDIIDYALKHEGFNKPYEISVVITDNEGIREINRKFRNIDKETDVLSFPMIEFEDEYNYDNEEVEMEIENLNPESGEIVLGDIVISLEKAKSQAEEYGHSYEREIAFLVVHSVLHLLGYDHEQEDDRAIMRRKEESILSQLGFLR